MTSKINKKYGSEHARLERRYVYIHLGIFVLVHGIFILIFGLVPKSDLPSSSYFIHIMDWVLHKDIGFYRNDMANSISAIWITVLFIHSIWGFSYTLFPRKKKSDEKTEVETNDQKTWILKVPQ